MLRSPDQNSQHQQLVTEDTVVAPTSYKAESEGLGVSVTFPVRARLPGTHCLPSLSIPFFTSSLSFFQGWGDRLPHGAAFCSPFCHTQERACSASSYIFMACCVAASSPFPAENDAFENDYGHHLPQKQPRYPHLGSRRSPFGRKSWPGRDSGTRASPLGCRHQESVRQAPFRTAIGHQFQRGALDAKRSHQDPFCLSRPREPGRKCPERKHRTFSLLYSPLRI